MAANAAATVAGGARRGMSLHDTSGIGADIDTLENFLNYIKILFDAASTQCCSHDGLAIREKLGGGNIPQQACQGWSRWPCHDHEYQMAKNNIDHEDADC